MNGGGDSSFHDHHDNATQVPTSVATASLAFPCPLLMTSLHFLAQWMFAETLCTLWPLYWGSQGISRMSWRLYLSVAVPCGVVTSADIGLSNLSYVTLSLTLYTLIKSSTPVFVLLWARLFGLLPNGITFHLFLVIALITFGEYVLVGGRHNHDEVSDSTNTTLYNGTNTNTSSLTFSTLDLDTTVDPTIPWTGVILCLCAAVLSGARWTLVQLKLQTLQPPLQTTVATMRLLAPSMFVSLFWVSLLLEEPWNRLPPYYQSRFDEDDRMLQHNGEAGRSLLRSSVDHKFNATAAGTDGNVLLDSSLSSSWMWAGTLHFFALGMIGAGFAIAMILCEFYLIMKTNALVLTVGGVLKELITIVVGVLIFEDELTGRMMVGCTIVFGGVILYKCQWSKEQQQQRSQLQTATSTKNAPERKGKKKSSHSEITMLLSGTTDDDESDDEEHQDDHKDDDYQVREQRDVDRGPLSPTHSSSSSSSVSSSYHRRQMVQGSSFNSNRENDHHQEDGAGVMMVELTSSTTKG